MKTGIELMADERQFKQIEKHGFTAEHHANHPEWYDKGQLPQAARLLSLPDDEDLLRSTTVSRYLAPKNWDKDWFLNLMSRPYLERLIIAGALLASEIDRLNFIEEQNAKQQQ